MLVSVTVRPRARAAHVGGSSADGRLLVSVRAAPDGGAANDELVRVLATAFAVPRSCVRIVRGASARQKQVMIEGASASDVSRLKDNACAATKRGLDRE